MIVRRLPVAFLLAELALVATFAACGGSGDASGGAAMLTADVRGIGGGSSVTAGGPMPPGLANQPSAPGDAGSDAMQREIAAADVYAVDGDRLVLGNAWRGLAVVDLATGSILSRTQLGGMPHELYLIGTRAYVIVGTEPTLTDPAATSLVEVDLTDASQPVVAGRAAMEGWFRDSRRVGSVLYAVTSAGAFSFETGVSPFVQRAALPLALEATQVLTTNEHLFFAVPCPDGDTDLRVLDIGDVNGAIGMRGSLRLSGHVADAQKMHFARGHLRVVSHDGSGFVSRLRTISVDDPEHPVVRGELALARGEQLFGTNFTDDRAYIVTFERIDPLWVVDLSDATNPRVTGELQVPGFSTQVVPSGNQLVTLGYDGPWSEPVLSLFDVADPTRPRLASRIAVGNVDPQAFHEPRALRVDADSVLVPLWNGLAVVDRAADALALRGTVPVPGGSKRGLEHSQGLVAIGSERVVVADAASLQTLRSVTIAENVVAVTQLGDGSVVDVVQSGDRTSVRGAEFDLVAERAYAHGDTVAVVGWTQTGRELRLLDCSTTPPAVLPPIALGYGGYAVPLAPRADLGMPNGGLWAGYSAEAIDALLPDGTLVIRALPNTVGVDLGTGDLRDGFAVVDLVARRELPGIGVRGAAITGAAADGTDLLVTLGRPAGHDRPGRPLLRNALHRTTPRAATSEAPVDVPGRVLAANGTLVHTLLEQWDSDWSWSVRVASVRVQDGKAEVLDKLSLPYGAYDLHVGNGLLVWTGVGSQTLIRVLGGPIGVPQSTLGSLHLSALLSYGPTLADSSFRRILRVDGQRVLCARDMVGVEAWDFGGTTAALVFDAATAGFAQSAILDLAQPGDYVLACGYAGSVRVP